MFFWMNHQIMLFSWLQPLSYTYIYIIVIYICYIYIFNHHQPSATNQLLSINYPSFQPLLTIRSLAFLRLPFFGAEEGVARGGSPGLGGSGAGTAWGVAAPVPRRATRAPGGAKHGGTTGGKTGNMEEILETSEKMIKICRHVFLMDFEGCLCCWTWLKLCLWEDDVNKLGAGGFIYLFHWKGKW